MLREVDINEISDGRFYTSSDMVKAGCNGCEGCSSCCSGMGSSIILDPLDIHRLCIGLGKSFEELMMTSIELNVVDGIILPNLKMSGSEDACSFLNSEGRCTIHPFRPGICRLFPLGRFYENDTFKYFLQVHECPKPNKTKVKIKKWLDTPDLQKYEAYISDWHNYLKKLQEQIHSGSQIEAEVKTLSMHILKTFYLTPFEEEQDFYEQFNKRLQSGTGYF